MEIKLIDSNIRHIPSFNGYETPKNIIWYRGNERRDIAVYTDHHIGECLYHWTKIKIAWLMEPRVINSRSYAELLRHMDKYDYVISHDNELLSELPVSKRVWCPGSGSSMYKHEWKIYPKTKSILTIVGSKHYAPGHKLRYVIADLFKDDVDVIGRGYNPFKPEDRAKTYAPYRYQIVVHNCNVADYWTDILADCFLTGTIPIVWGGEFLDKYFDIEGILRFNDLDELHQHIDYISCDKSEEMYNDMLDIIRTNFELAKNFAVAEDYLYYNFFKQFDESPVDIS